MDMLWPNGHRGRHQQGTKTLSLGTSVLPVSSLLGTQKKKKEDCYEGEGFPSVTKLRLEVRELERLREMEKLIMGDHSTPIYINGKMKGKV